MTLINNVIYDNVDGIKSRGYSTRRKYLSLKINNHVRNNARGKITNPIYAVYEKVYETLGG